MIGKLKRDLLSAMGQIFEDRAGAGQQLAKELQKTSRSNVMLIALPRGGVSIAAPIASALKTPIEVLFVRRLGAEFNPELGIGAIVEGNPPQTFLNQELVRVLKVSDSYIEEEKKKQLDVMRAQQKLFRAGQDRPHVAGKSVILVDDGIATGSTIHAALKGLRSEKPAKLTLAVPVAPPETIAELKKEVDEVICLLTPAEFQAVGQFYRHFPRLEDSEVLSALKASGARV